MGDHILWCCRQDRHVCVEVGWTDCYDRAYLAGLTFDTAVVKLLRVFETRKGITSAQNRNNGLLSIQTVGCYLAACHTDPLFHKNEWGGACPTLPGQYQTESMSAVGLKHYVKSKCSEDEYMKFCAKYHLENIILQLGEANAGELSTCYSLMLLLLLCKK